MRLTAVQRKAYRKQIGKELKVRLSGNHIIHAWKLWEMSLESSNPAAGHLSKEVGRIIPLYEQHAPEVPPDARLRRALRMALKLLDFEVLAPDGDESDLRVLMLSNGLKEGDFFVLSDIEKPIALISYEAMQQLGVFPIDGATIH